MRAKPHAVDVSLLRRCMGLEPFPPRTDLAIERGETLPCGTFERRLISFESRPGVRLAANAYLPDHPGPHPFVLIAAEQWEEGRKSAWVQAMGLSLAMQGFAALAIDPPGVSDRAAMGPSRDPQLSASLPAAGVYVWDLMRAIDVAGIELGAMIERVGLVGVGVGGEAALLCAALDSRIACVVVGGAGHSQEMTVDGTYGTLPGIAEIGDWANVLAGRAGLPIHFLAAESDAPERIESTAKKLRGTYSKSQQTHVRLDRFLGGRDLNRRMREAASGFLATHLQGAEAKIYVPEPLPMTDGLLNSAPANTEDPSSLSWVTQGLSFMDLASAGLAAPYPDQTVDLIPWGKYGRLDALAETETIRLVDHGDSPNVLVLPALDPQLLIPLGLSLPDFYAQLLHLWLPGAPEGWEPLGLQGDALTAMIASVRTLIRGAETKHPPKRVEAEGPLSSLTARILGHFRPELEIEVSHSAGDWIEVLAQGVVVPGARYRKWPFNPTVVGEESVAESVHLDEDLPIDASEDLREISAAPAGAEGFPSDEPVADQPDPSYDGERHDQAKQ